MARRRTSPAAVRRAWAMALGLVAASALPACAPEAPPALAAPPFALAAPPAGGYRAGLHLAVSAARDQLRGPYGPVDAADLRLADGTSWADVEAFYARAVPDGFERVALASTDPAGYRLAVWARGRSAVAVVFVPDAEGPGASLSVLRSRGRRATSA